MPETMTTLTDQEIEQRVAQAIEQEEDEIHPEDVVSGKGLRTDLNLWACDFPGIIAALEQDIEKGGLGIKIDTPKFKAALLARAPQDVLRTAVKEHYIDSSDIDPESKAIKGANEMDAKLPGTPCASVDRLMQYLKMEVREQMEKGQK